MNQTTRTWSGSGLSKSRIEALTDGVFAIAMTLLVFGIKVPELPRSPAQARLQLELLALWPNFLSYAISFVMLGIYWVGHHNQFHYIRLSDRALLWINMLFLMCVTLIPFSAGLMGQYPRQRIAVVIYGSNLFVVGLSLYAQWWYSTSGHRLVDRDLDLIIVTLAKRRILLGLMLVLLSIGVSFYSTKLSLLLYAILPLPYILPGRIDRHWSPSRSLLHDEAREWRGDS